MAITALAVQQISRAGLTPVFSAANAEGHTVVNNGNTTFVEVKNTGVETTVTIDITQTVDGVTPAAKSVVVPATTGDKIIGPFPKGIYDQSGSDAGKIHVHFSQVTGVTCAAFQI